MLMIVVIVLCELICWFYLVGMVVVVGGLVVIGMVGGGLVMGMIIVGFLLMLCVVFLWVSGNIVIKCVGLVNVVSLVVWGVVILFVLFFLLFYWLEGLEQIVYSLVNISVLSIGVIVYLFFGVIIFGYSFWSCLLVWYVVS